MTPADAEHRPANVRDLLEQAVDLVPDQPFLIWQDETTTYRQFDESVNRAASMWQRLGIRKGDRVAFMVDNCPEFLAAWLGLAKIGAVLVAINTELKAEEARYVIEQSEARFVLVSDTHEMVMKAVAAQVSALSIVTLGTGPGCLRYRDLVAWADATVGQAHIDPDDVIAIIYTSGTTGRPKGVVQTHGNYVLTAQAYPDWVGLRPGERCYVCLPLFHINAQIYGTMGTIGARASMVLAPRFSATRFWDEVRRHDVAVFNFVGAILMILSMREPSALDRHHRARVAYGAPTLAPSVRDAIETRFGITVLSGFGMSETSFGLIETASEVRRPFSMGKPRQHPDPRAQRNEARIVDADGAELPAGEVGELIFRNPALMKGYFKDAERTAQALRNGWLYTGDLARRDEDGFFYYVDRRRDVIRRRGENVSSVEVEGALAQHPDVLEAAVLGVPSELTDEEILAVIVPRPGRAVDPEELAEWCLERLAAFKVPRYVRVVQALPKTPSQKVQKDRLRLSWRDGGDVIDLHQPFDAVDVGRLLDA